MNSLFRYNKSVAVVALVITVLFSCTKVDNQLGEDLIPDDQKMKIFVDTLYGVNTYLTQPDSFATSGLTYGFLGSCVDSVFGRTSAAFCSQFMMSYFSSGDEMFGIAPVLDSLELRFTVNASALGDTTKVQKFNVYELDSLLYYDSTYYADFNPLDKIKDEVLCSFELTGLPDSEIAVKFDSPSGLKFAQRLMDTTGGCYTGDSLFFNRFKGFCFIPDETSPQDAAVYRIAFSSIEMILYTRNHTDETAASVKDTVEVYYSFDNTYYYTGRVSSINHDYSQTQIQNIGDTLATSSPLEYGYIQSLGGVATFVRFTDEFVDELCAKVVEPYHSIVINKASLLWPVRTISPEAYAIAPTRLGAYTDYTHLTNILDYDYTYESSADVTLMYDGYLNRTYGRYPTDLSIFLQELIRDPENSPRTFVLGVSTDQISEFNQVVLKTGASDPPLRVALTYTLIR
ncbi:MAG TPA: DUF4270 domain-containing protein [Candidatus Alistipes merdigallinarum]|nr:DUF4270 domain-containing protein [Candidatus Alistipes merdigallinarum]